jgi:hypothetical protein
MISNVENTERTFDFLHANPRILSRFEGVVTDLAISTKTYLKPGMNILERDFAQISADISKASAIAAEFLERLRAQGVSKEEREKALIFFREQIKNALTNINDDQLIGSGEFSTVPIENLHAYRYFEQKAAVEAEIAAFKSSGRAVSDAVPAYRVLLSTDAARLSKAFHEDALRLANTYHELKINPPTGIDLTQEEVTQLKNILLDYAQNPNWFSEETLKGALKEVTHYEGSAKQELSPLLEGELTNLNGVLSGVLISNQLPPVSDKTPLSATRVTEIRNEITKILTENKNNKDPIFEAWKQSVLKLTRAGDKSLEDYFADISRRVKGKTINPQDVEILAGVQRSLETARENIGRGVTYSADSSDPLYDEKIQARQRDFLETQLHKIEELRNEIQGIGEFIQKDKALKEADAEMGEYAITKRFLLANKQWSYDQVKSMNRQQLYSAVFALIAKFTNTTFPPYKPFGALDYKIQMVTQIELPSGDLHEIKLADVLRDLKPTESVSSDVEDDIGAIQAFLRFADVRNSDPLSRFRPDTFINYIKQGNVPNKYSIKGIFQNEAFGGEIKVRAWGVSIPNGELLRLSLSFALTRGVLAEDEILSDPNNPHSRKIKYKKRYPSPFAHGDQLDIPVEKRQSFIAKKQIEEALVQRIMERNNSFAEWDGDKPISAKAAVEAAKVAAHNAVLLMMSVGETYSVRALHDHEGARTEAYDDSTFFHYFLIQEKYVRRDRVKNGIKKLLGGTLGKIRGFEGKPALPLQVAASIEKIWTPALVRYRFRPHYFYEEDGKIKLAQEEKTFQGVVRKEAIPNKTLMTGADIAHLKEILESGGEIPPNMLLDKKGNLLTIPPGGRLYVESITDLIDQFVPDDPPSHESLIIEHVADTIKGFTDWPFDPAKIVEQTERMGGGSFADFSREEAEVIKKFMRSACFYWLNDTKMKGLTKEEFEEFKKNYAKPVYNRALENKQQHEKRLADWKRDWEWRGIPLQSVKRDENGSIKLDEDGNPQVEYGEYAINQLFNLHIEPILRGMLRNGEISQTFFNQASNDFARVTKNPDQLLDQDQFGEFMRIIMEKMIQISLLKFKRSRGAKRWDYRCTDVLMEILSEEHYWGNRSGIKNFFTRKQRGIGGITSVGGSGDDWYDGVGGWSKEEARHLIASIFTQTEMYRGQPKTKKAA